MAETTGISWTDHTFNCWIGCAQVSPGCAHCYAKDLAEKRMGYDVWDGKQKKARHITSASYWRQPINWNRKAQEAGVRRRVFCASMADVFEDHPDLPEVRLRLWSLIHETKHLDWLLLTKRPENVLRMLPPEWQARLADNIWLGTSVENQHFADIRIPQLLQILAKVRFLSCEPLLGAVDLSAWLPIYKPEEARRAGTWDQLPWSRSVSFPINPLHWVIAGGESGPKHRPVNIDWLRTLRDQCTAANVPYFMKQIGGKTSKSGGDLLDGQRYHAWPHVTYTAEPVH